MSEAVIPRSFSEAAAALAGAAAQKRAVRIVGGATKLGWGGATPARALQLHTAHLSRVVISEDQRSATVNAGTPLAHAQAIFARSGLMLAADPQLGLGRGPAATVGGVVATADTGPLSHRHGPLRDQIVGITAALSDGNIVRTGPRSDRPRSDRPRSDRPRSDHVQDGFDINRLFTGCFGTLGVILAVDVRLCPLPGETATALASSGEPDLLSVAALQIARAHPELEALDIAWRGGRGGILAQLGSRASNGGAGTAQQTASAAAAAVAETMRGCGLGDASVRTDDAGLWARQRAGQRSRERAILRVQHRPAQLGDVLRAADGAAATVVGRAALGISYLTLDVAQIATVRAAIAGDAAAVALDLPVNARGSVDAWNVPDGPELELMRDLKQRFDPAGICNPGVYVGSI